MPNISKICQHKRSSHLLEVWVEGELAIIADQEVIAHRGLHSGDPLTTEALEELRSADQVLQAGRKAQGLLAHRARSRQELVRALRQKGFADPTIQTTLERLEQVGLVNDEAFARQMAESLAQYRQLGSRAIQQKLRLAGLAPQLVQEVLAETADEQQEMQRARAGAEKYLSRTRAEDDTRLRAKLFGYLQRRGFAAGLCRQVTEELLPPTW
ncbi:MAG TPA: regulatory protein RecX [Armatimonadota bacterium]